MIGDIPSSKETIDYVSIYTHQERTEYMYYMHEVLLKSGDIEKATTLRELMYKTIGTEEKTLADFLDFDGQCKDYQEVCPNMQTITQYLRTRRVDQILG